MQSASERERERQDAKRIREGERATRREKGASDSGRRAHLQHLGVARAHGGLQRRIGAQQGRVLARERPRLKGVPVHTPAHLTPVNRGQTLLKRGQTPVEDGQTRPSAGGAGRGTVRALSDMTLLVSVPVLSESTTETCPRFSVTSEFRMCAASHPPFSAPGGCGAVDAFSSQGRSWLEAMRKDVRAGGRRAPWFLSVESCFTEGQGGDERRGSSQWKVALQSCFTEGSTCRCFGRGVMPSSHEIQSE